MAYTPITTRLIALMDESSKILARIDSERGLLHIGVNGMTILGEIQDQIQRWGAKN